MTRAFAYLIRTSARNKLLSQIRQLRNPRYAIALLLGLLYFSFVLFNQSARQGRQPNPLVSDTFAALLPFGVLVYVAFLWIFGADRAALAFSEAEVSMLFPGPVSRRALIIYKLVRAQAPVLTTSILWLILFRPSGSGVARVVASWVFLTTFSMHRLGVALLHASRDEHGSIGLRKSWLPLAVFGAAATALIVGLLSARDRFASLSGPGEIWHLVITESARAPLAWVLYPFRIAVAPMFAQSNQAWLQAILPALVLLALHVVWVLRGDTAFEEAAAEASAAQAARRQALRTRGATGGVVNPKSARRTIMLSPSGAPEIALIWKNWLWLIRTGQIRGMVGLPAAALIISLVFAGRSNTAEILVAVMCTVLVVVILVFGPMVLRNDLRGDLRRLPMLKTLPMKGREIMLAEVVSSAAPIALMQLLLGMVALLALSFVREKLLPVDIRIGMLLAAPVLLLGLSVANFTIHNGMALLFPAWVKLGTAGSAGVEAMGQMMLTSIVSLFLLAILLVLPAIAGAAVYFVMQWPPLFAVAGAGIAAGVAFGLEGYLLIGALGGALDRLEPMHLG